MLYTSPKPEGIRAAREAAGLTPPKAAELVFTSGRVWRQWEAAERRMHPAFWCLFRLRIAGAELPAAHD